MSLQVRPTTYRGKVGFALTGRPPASTSRVSIFFEHRSAAVRHREALKADPRAEIDWRP